MSELIERIEAATGPDRELDAAIAIASGQYVVSRHHPGMFAHKDEPKQFSYFVPAYTASIDAAMTLVPEGWMLELEQHTTCWTATLGSHFWADDRRVEKDASAPTPALALCAAALRARSTEA